MTNNFHHISVLLNETIQAILPTKQLIEQLKIENCDTIYMIDATLGGAGHASSLVHAFFANESCKNFKLHLIGIDQDTNAIKVSTQKLEALKKEYSRFNYNIFHANFDQLNNILSAFFAKKTANPKIHGLYADFGVSSPQIDTQERGFSFLHEGPLDMRMDQTNTLTAEKILCTYPEAELAQIFFEYGEEPKSRILAKAIVHDRKHEKLPIQNTKIFAEYLKKILKYGFSRTHPATRVFQALRIEVNNELGAIQTLLQLVPNIMHNKGKSGFISFHSLEDRLVKRSMRLWQENKFGKELPRGGIVPTKEEIENNPRARSARLRVFEFDG